jgi:hypothetical protein
MTLHRCPIRPGRVPDRAIDRIAALLFIADLRLPEARAALAGIVDDVADLERRIGSPPFTYVIVTATGDCVARAVRDEGEVLVALDTASRLAFDHGLLFELRLLVDDALRARVAMCASQLGGSGGRA